MSEAVVVADPKTVLGQPRGLVVLFFAEMWERFSFYGMRALLIFYLTQHFLFGDAAAAGIYASYGALVYLMPLLGGLIADRYLGFRKAVIFGAVLLCIGHFGMAIEGEPAQRDRDGVASRSGVVADLLRVARVHHHRRRLSEAEHFEHRRRSCTRRTIRAATAASRIFYMGINLGAMLASSIVGYLGQTFGWAYGFGLAGVGMLAGLVTFVRGQHLFGDGGIAKRSGPALTEVVFAGVTRERMIYVAGLVGVVVAWQLVQWHEVVGGLLLVAAVVTVVGIVGFAVLRLPPVERDRMLVVLYLLPWSRWCSGRSSNRPAVR